MPRSTTPGAHSDDDKFLIAAPGIKVPLAELTYTFSRSAGPGGQNVNKVNSKARLRWRVADSSSLEPGVRARFMAQNRHRITADGEFVIASQRFRDQPRNAADCREKLQALLAIAARPPARRKKTNPSAGSRRRRLVNKRRRSATKELRRRPGTQD